MTLRTVAILFCIAVGLTAYTLIYETGAAIWEGAGLVFRGLERANVVRVEIARHADVAARVRRCHHAGARHAHHDVAEVD